MKAIETKYIPASDTKPSRIKATAEGGHSLTVGYSHELNDADAHRYAAELLQQKLKWPGRLIGGVTKSGYAFCFVQGDAELWSALTDVINLYHGYNDPRMHRLMHLLGVEWHGNKPRAKNPKRRKARK